MAERRGGGLKTGVIELFQNTLHALLRYQCYALEFVSFARERLC